MHSALYLGHVAHHRTQPKRHRFRYPLFMVYLDLAELDGVFRGRWFWSTRRPNLAWFRRSDHFGDPDVPLDDAVRTLVEQRTGHRPTGPIRLLTHLRYFGYVMNPVVFYYCFDSDDHSRIEAIVADVSNTPWDERHQYVLRPETDGTAHVFEFDKAFHVSPFMAMRQTYHWAFTQPGERLAVTMRNLQSGDALFSAVLKMKRRPLTTRNLAGVLVRYPAMTLAVVARIYWQALRLWLKRTPYYEHPKNQTDTAADVQSNDKEMQRA